MILAIYGPSCVGKTTIARILTTQLRVPVRLCGDVVRQASVDLGLDINALPDLMHREIDAETICWANSSSGLCLVEGRYLDQVLAPLKSSIVLICFAATPQARAERWEMKTGLKSGLSQIRQVDALDAAFRKKMYKNIQRFEPSITVDTTSQTPEESASCLMFHIENRKQELG